jgi:iron-sulfur cluster assembly protein
MATTAYPITITERAAAKVRAFMQEEGAGVDVLRIAVQGGGCSGFQYALGFDGGPADGDLVVAMHGVRVVVDPFSLPYLRGSDVDYIDGLQGTGFQIDNPNVVAGCGCGSSFQVKDEEPDATADAAGGCSTCGSH